MTMKTQDLQKVLCLVEGLPYSSIIISKGVCSQLGGKELNQIVLVSFHKHRVFAKGSLSCLPPGSPQIVFLTKGKAFDILGISSRRVGGLFHNGALDYSVISPTGSLASKLCVARVDIKLSCS
jgi:hypothetical protein